jgi:HK97 family phage major capsid protein
MIHELRSLYREADVLANKAHLTPSEERQYSLLLSRISTVKKTGISLDELSRQDGEFTLSQRANHKAWVAFARGEQRTEAEGNLVEQIGTYSNLGYFSPVDFLASVKSAMRWHDPLFDAANVSYVETQNGHTLTVPLMNDTDEEAAILGENVQDTANGDIETIGFAQPAMFSYRSPLWKISLESLQDINVGMPALNFFAKFSADRIARRVGSDLTVGNGSGEPLGLIPSLLAAGVVPVTALGSATNDGSSNTGANSIGTTDLNDVYFSVDPAYRQSPQCAWLMNDSSLKFISSLLDKSGRPIVHLIDGVPTILGKRVLVSPSMASIGASAYSVAFGDLSYWMTRCARDGGYIKSFFEAAGYAEQGTVGFRCFARYGGCLLYTGAGSKSPIALLQQHS